MDWKAGLWVILTLLIILLFSGVVFLGMMYVGRAEKVQLTIQVRHDPSQTYLLAFKQDTQNTKGGSLYWPDTIVNSSQVYTFEFDKGQTVHPILFKVDSSGDLLYYSIRDRNRADVTERRAMAVVWEKEIMMTSSEDVVLDL